MTSHNFLRSRFPLARRLRPAILAVIVTSALALSSCNSGGTPDGPNTSAPSSSESAAPSVTPTPKPSAAYVPASASGPAKNVPVPVLPEVAKTETKEGATAFAGYWFSVLSYAYESGDLAHLATIAPPSCAPCQKATEVINAWHSEGRWLVGGQITTPVIETMFTKDAEAKYKVAVQVHQLPLTYFRADGSVARSDSQQPDTGNLLLLSYSDDGWHLHDVGNIVG